MIHIIIIIKFKTITKLFASLSFSNIFVVKRRSRTVLSSVLGKTHSLTDLDSVFLLMGTSLLPFELVLFSVFTLVGVLVPLELALDVVDFDAC